MRNTLHLDLLIPGLSGPTAPCAAGQEQRHPALERLLGAARLENHPYADEPGGYEQTLCALFGLDPRSAPIAALSLLGEGAEHSTVASSGHWCRADAVRLKAEHDRVYLLEAPPSGLSQEQFKALMGEIAPLYSEEGWQLLAADGGRGYIRYHDMPQVVVSGPIALLGADIHPHLPQGESGAPWRRLLNELQMLLHTSHANGEREAAGLAQVNGLWLWGMGSLEGCRVEPRWRALYGNSPLLAGVAAQAGALCSPLPYATLPTIDEDSLWLEQRLALHAARRDPYWYTQLDELERQLFSPLLQRLQAGEIERLTLYDASGRSYRIERRAMRRWWPRKRRIDWLMEQR